MPGFTVQSLGGTRPAAQGRVQLYHTHSWEIEDLFEQNVGLVPALIMARDMTLPTFTVDREVVSGASLKYKFAKDITWDDIRVVWYDSVGMARQLQTWRQRVWNSERGLGHASDYKRRSTLTYSLPDLQSKVSWQLFGSWPAVIKQGELTYTSSEVKIVEVTVSYDWAEESVG